MSQTPSEERKRFSLQGGKPTSATLEGLTWWVPLNHLRLLPAPEAPEISPTKDFAPGSLEASRREKKGE